MVEPSLNVVKKMLGLLVNEGKEPVGSKPDKDKVKAIKSTKKRAKTGRGRIARKPLPQKARQKLESRSLMKKNVRLLLYTSQKIPKK